MLAQMEEWPQVEAIALGGSRATGVDDPKSDYDFYVYISEDVPEEERRRVFGEYCKRLEIGNSYWENEDNGTLKNGVDIDVVWRNLDYFTGEVAAVVEGGRASNGYTTSLWHNLTTCKILFDRNGRLAAAKERFAVDYPDQLRHNIIERNMNLLTRALPAYDRQISKAAARGDIVAVNHRVAAFLESYFDVIFALNRQPNPGEKRLIPQALRRCELLPEGFRTNLLMLFASMFTSDPHDVDAAVKTLVDGLEQLVDEHE
ncbi:DUF4037 domain-containing protein [Bifidobacterium sp. BRDM6]|uniref:DUF4037 domain-containing protein n=2 Tax=Bifidobacterium choloepi TaxID=2614131 RepID=A0A6I5MZ25_9BIFI|nr:DUF4037 domain-containing protein [Bifidobacterium choloepi]